MKTKMDAAKVLLNVGWDILEIKAVLGNVPELGNMVEPQPDSPWWIWVEKGWTTNSPSVPEWEAWMGLD